MILINLLAGTNYIILNKELIKILGLHEAILLGELCSECVYWSKEKKLTDEKYFFSTRENIKQQTGLTPFQQRAAIETLIKFEIIECKNIGMPKQTYYSINDNKIYELLNTKTQSSTFLTSSSKENEHQDVKIPNINNNNNNNKNITHQKINFAEKVFLYQEEYDELIKKYGSEKTQKFIYELNIYKKSNGKNYESDYCAILRWVIDRVKELEKNKYIKGKLKINFEEREYNENFLESFYDNLEI